MCLSTKNEWNEQFKKKHDSEDTIRVWKLYNKWKASNRKYDNILVSPFHFQSIIKGGVIKFKSFP